MRIRTMVIATGVLLAVGAAGAAYAQASAKPGAAPTGFNYDMRSGQRVEKPDSKTVAEDGTVREEFRSGNCVTIKERRPDGAVKTTRRCD